MSRALSSAPVRLAFAGLAALGFLVLLVGLVIALVDWIGGTDAEEEMATIEEVTIAYGASEGPEGCEFLSASVLDQMGGESGCTRAHGRRSALMRAGFRKQALCRCERGLQLGAG